MRLIDELLKDDFFHGGFQPAAAATASPAAAAAGATPGAAPGAKKPIVLIAAIAAGVLVIGGGAAFFLLRGGKSEPAVAPPAATAPAPAAPAAPAPAAQAAAEPAAEQVPAAAAAPEAAPAPDAAAPPPAEAPAEPAAAAPAPPQAEPAAPEPPAVDLSKYTVSIPKLSDKAKAQKILAALGGKGKLRDESKKSTVFRVVSQKSYPPAEAKAVQLKATIFKVEMSIETLDSGEVRYVFGTFPSQLDAALGGGKAKPIGVPTTVEKKETGSEAYFIDIDAAGKDEAEKLLAAANAAGAKAKLKKVK